MIQIHGLVKKYGDRITVHWHPPGPAGGRRAVASLCAQGGGTPLGLRKILHKFYTNLLSLLRLFAPCLPYSYQQDDRARATREGAYEADIRTATIPVSASGLCGEFRAETDVVAGHLVGRVEHIVSGQATTFQTLEDLLAFMARIHRRIFKYT